MYKFNINIFVFIFLFIFTFDAFSANKGRRAVPQKPQRAPKPSERLQTPSRPVESAIPEADFSSNVNLVAQHLLTRRAILNLQETRSVEKENVTPAKDPISELQSSIASHADSIVRTRLFDLPINPQDVTKIINLIIKNTDNENTVRRNFQTLQLLREHSSDIDPKETHIPELARLLDPYISSIEETIHFQSFSDTESRLGHLTEFLKPLAKDRQEAQQVTYEWFIRFSLQLGILIQPDSWTNYYERPGLVSMLVDSFPQTIIIPTISQSSEGRSLDVFLGINENDQLVIDSFDDLYFLSHDIQH